MLNFVLPLLKNPLTRIVAEKTVGAIQHKLEKDKIIKAKEIEAAQNISIEQVRAQKDSFKDEWLCIFFTLVFAGNFLPWTQPWFEKGWTILEKADPMFWYIIITIVGASFGVTTMNKIKKK